MEAATDPNVSFEVIEETLYMDIEAPVFSEKYSVLDGFQSFEEQSVWNFFKEFVKHGMDDARYYDLFYTMMTHRLNGSFPLGFAMSE